MNRRSFLQSSGGVATGLAVVAVPPAALALATPAAAKAEPAAHRVDPLGDVPDEPVMAYVHHPGRGEVTVLSGTTERTIGTRSWRSGCSTPLARSKEGQPQMSSRRERDKAQPAD